MTLNDMHITAINAERNPNPLAADFLNIAAYVRMQGLAAGNLNLATVHADNAKEMLTRVSDAVLDYLVAQFAKPSLPGYPTTNPHLQATKALAREWVRNEYHRRHHREVTEPIGHYTQPGVLGDTPVYDVKADGQRDDTQLVATRFQDDFVWIRVLCTQITIY